MKPWDFVTPFAGVWIEIFTEMFTHPQYGVTPFAGVWIEIQLTCHNTGNDNVTPFAGVWIEIMRLAPTGCLCCRHSLRGSVD